MKALTQYTKKRKFSKTPEPSGRRSHVSKKGAKTLSFVVQRHEASHLHFDFRLEAGGVLKSWAIPKGPSMNPNDKRLAVMVEDHPIEYGKFRGVIPKGNYGAGTVEIWDNGTYSPLDGAGEKEVLDGIENGSIKFILHGKRLKGSFALVRMKSGNRKNWLLIKHKDEFSSTAVFDPDETAASLPPPSPPTQSRTTRKLSQFIQPMKAQLSDHAFDDDNWLFEVKWDGFRAVAEIHDGEVKLYSRNGLPFDLMYPAVVNDLKKFGFDIVLDGEIVVLDSEGRSSFQKLQQYRDHPRLPLVYYVFDVLSYDGQDYMKRHLVERKKLLEKIIPWSSTIRYSDHIEADGKKFFQQARKRDLEGIIAKRKDSLYVPGVRSPNWRKIKNHNTQEAIIAGFTAPKGSRKYFGALLLGIRSGNTLKYIGHTGTGFSNDTLKEVHSRLTPLIRGTSPFKNKIAVNSDVTWVEPRLVCQLKYAEVTEDGLLRQPVFLGLRADKSAAETDQLDMAAKS